MARDLKSYQANVGKTLEADMLFVKQGGYVHFYDEELTGAAMAAFILSNATQTQYISSVSVLAASVISPAYGYAYFSVAAGCSKCSIRLDTGTKGATLVFQFHGVVSNAGISIIPSGVSLVGLRGSDWSGLGIHASLMSVPLDTQATLICTSDNVWTVVDHGAAVIGQ